MAQQSREKVFAALYTLLQSANYPFEIVNTDGRVMKAWDQVSSAQQPALYLQQGPQKADQGAGGDSHVALNVWHYTANVWIYFRRDSSMTPATYINQITDAIDAVIQPSIGQRQTLAAQNNNVPLVQNIRITDVMFDDGTLDPQGGQCIVKVGLDIITP